MENETLKKSKTQKDRFLQSLNLAEINKNNNNYESIFDYCKNRKNSVVAKISGLSKNPISFHISALKLSRISLKMVAKA